MIAERGLTDSAVDRVRSCLAAFLSLVRVADGSCRAEPHNRSERVDLYIGYRFTTQACECANGHERRADKKGVRVAIVEFPIDGGGAVLVQTTQGGGPPGVVTRGIDVVPSVERAQHSFVKALDTIHAVSDSVLEQVNELRRRPDEIQVEFGLELSAHAGTALLAAAAGTAHLRVAITWKAGSATSGE
jgi:hypothetical protein